MVRSNNVIGTINFVAMLLSIPVIVSGIRLAFDPNIACFKISQLPFIIIGVLIFVVALSGVVGGFRGIQLLVVFYYIGMIIVIVLLTSLVAVHSRHGAGLRSPATCVTSSNICADLNQRYHTAKDFFNARLTTIQSGCCTAPKICNFTFVNATNWGNSRHLYPDDYDCQLWSNNQNKLCYKCDSCEFGLRSHINTEYKRANLILTFTLVVLIIVYSLGCFAKLGDIFTNTKQGHA